MTAAAIILAAGSSSRMGQSKQMLVINGEKLLVKTIQTVLGSGVRKVIVVLGSNESAHRKLIEDLPVDIVYNPNWEKGMGSSIKQGLAHFASDQRPPEGIIILACDQPLLHSEHIQKLLDKYQETGKPVIASTYSGMPGVPVLFDRAYYNSLQALPDKEGAKKIILQNPSDVALVPFPGGEIDLDTMEDYETFLQR